MVAQSARKVAPAEIEAALRLLVKADVVELRALGVSDGHGWPHTVTGYFDDLAAMACEAARLTSIASGVYFTLNPIRPELLARCRNRSRKAGKGESTSDADILRRCWLPIDCDAVRPAGISSSESEHDAALARSEQVAAFLSSRGWPDGIKADSGNGGHLLYAIDLPAEDGDLVKRALEALAGKFDDDVVTIDAGVGNAARIWKLPGTVARKGDSVPDRPHRVARLLSIPDDLGIVTREQVEGVITELAVDAVEGESESAPDHTYHADAHGNNSFDLEGWINEHGLDVRGPEAWRGGTRWVFNKCPWNASHADSSAVIVRRADGRIGAKCHHNGCRGKGWRALRDLVEPGWHRQRRTGAGGLVAIVADEICGQSHFARDAGGRLYVYVDGAYRPKGESFIKRRVKSIVLRRGLGAKWSIKLSSEVVEFIGVDAPELWHRPPDDRVNLSNGILMLGSRELTPHTHEYLSPVRIPVTYAPAATCPAIERFVRQVFPADAIEAAYQIPALLMTPLTSHQCAILLLGAGGNGKSRYLQLLAAFIGKPNRTAISLHRLESDKFAAARLFGKLANVCADLPSEHLAGTSVFKALTGGDDVSGEYKFKDSFEFTPFARLVFSANAPPRSSDSSEGFFRRWVTIPFERTFSADDIVPAEELDARLAQPSELSGLLNKALDAWPQVRRHGVTLSQSMQAAMDEFRATTDSLIVWLDHETTDLPDSFVTKDDLRAAYNRHAASKGMPPLTPNAMTTALRKRRPNIREGQRTVNGAVKYCWLGIGLVTR